MIYAEVWTMRPTKAARHKLVIKATLKSQGQGHKTLLVLSRSNRATEPKNAADAPYTRGLSQLCSFSMGIRQIEFYYTTQKGQGYGEIMSHVQEGLIIILFGYLLVDPEDELKERVFAKWKLH